MNTNKSFKILLVLALCLSNTVIAAGFTELDDTNTPPLARLTNIGTDSGLIFEVRAKDLDAAASKAKVDPVILGRVRGIHKIANFSSDFNKPTFSIATFKVVGSNEEWVATTSHRYHLRKGSARFRLPLVGLSDPNTKYRFYILTDTGATYAGPFEGTFSPADDALVTEETDSNQFPAALPSGFTKAQLDGIAEYILQRLVILPQSSHRDITSAVQLASGTNNFVITLPAASTPVHTFNKKVALNNSDDGSTNGGTASGISARGNFSTLASYSTGDIVSSDNSSFIASKSIPAGLTAPTRANISNPAVSQYWTLLVAVPDAVAPVTVVNNNTTITPQGTFNSTSGYKKGDTVIFGGSTFLATQDIPAGTLPNPNSSTGPWSLVATGTPVTTEEDVALPGNGTITLASLLATNPSGNNSPATVIALKSSTNSVVVTMKFSFSGGNLSPISYEVGGVTTNFGGTGPVAPTTNGTALTIVGQDYAVFFANNKINLKNLPLLGSYTAKTINLKYKAF